MYVVLPSPSRVAQGKHNETKTENSGDTRRYTVESVRDGLIVRINGDEKV